MSRFSFGNSLTLSTLISLAALIFGLYFFRSQWDFSESGHEYLFFGYVGLSTLLFFLLRLGRKNISFIIAGLMIFILYCADAKFDWRKSYVLSSQTSEPFAMEAYIDSYPTFEAHHFSRFLHTPRWVNFSEDCFQPLLNAQSTADMQNIPQECKSEETIKESYNIDIVQIIRDHHKKMRSTAEKVEKGRFKRTSHLEKCIRDKRCALIPLLPPEAEGLTRESEEYIDIRRQFWHLVEERSMLREHCEFFDFCRVMLEADIIEEDRIL